MTPDFWDGFWSGVVACAMAELVLAVLAGAYLWRRQERKWGRIPKRGAP
jgi:hypothetical protein